jgi:2-polyprenyl-3-methyl-5-hydroxy-6-metoxy-1,4-benzoquinol methylase
VQAQREIDKTHLSCEQAEERGFLHRDYIAHCLRWSHVVKHLQNKYKTARILDIGCGKETPLIKTLYTMRMTPEVYVGVDYNKPVKQEIHDKIYDKMGGGNFELIWNWDASLKNAFISSMDFTPTLITCFEVLEHVTPEKVLGIINNIKLISDKDTICFISTPCFNGKAAANHINEMTYEFMWDLMREHFVVEEHWGTFASQRDIEPKIFTNDLEGAYLEHAYTSLKKYYDSNLLSVLFAPLFPQQSRNCMWKLTTKI